MGKLRRGLFFFLMMCVATAASGLLAYMLVTHSQTRPRAADGPSPVEMLEAQLIRGFSNHLVSASNAFALRVPPGQALSLETRQWVDRQFRADINSLRLNLAEAAGGLGNTGPILLNAADRLAALAAQPDRESLRERTLREVKQAKIAAEEHLRGSRADRWLAEPPVIPAW